MDPSSYFSEGAEEEKCVLFCRNKREQGGTCLMPIQNLLQLKLCILVDSYSSGSQNLKF